MHITGAVLEEIGRNRDYVDTRPIVVTDLELDEPGESEVLIRVEAAGLCHSDLSVVDGNRPRPLPMLLGHEAAGRIEQLGENTTGFAIGDRVVMTFLPRCGSCEGCLTNGIRPCIPGSRANDNGTLMGGSRRLRREGHDVNHHLGVSGFASHTVVDQRSLVKVDDDVPPDIAAVMGCAVLTGGGAILNAAHLHPGDTIAVVGLGGVGMAAVLTALSHEDVEVVAVDSVPSKRSAAAALGAHRAISPQEAHGQSLRANTVIEAAGNVAAFELAVAITQAGGRTITVGLPAPAPLAQISPLSLVAEGRTIIGSYLGSAVPRRDIPRFIDLWRAGRLPIEQLISDRIALADVNAGMDALARGTAIRQIIDFADVK